MKYIFMGPWHQSSHLRSVLFYDDWYVVNVNEFINQCVGVCDKLVGTLTITDKYTI